MGQDNNYTPSDNIEHERRLAKCFNGGVCEVSERQAIIMRELDAFRVEFRELKTAVNEVVVVFNDAKTVVNFLGKAGILIRWLAITIAAGSAVWAALTHWPKH